MWQRLATTLVPLGDRDRVLDTTALPDVPFQRAHHARIFRGLAAFGRRGARHETSDGFELVLLTSLMGIPLAAELVPANLHDLPAREAFLARDHDLVVVADKAFRSRPQQQTMSRRWSPDGGSTS